MQLRIFIALLLMFAAPPAMAQSTAPGDLALLLKQLADPDFQTREKARKQLDQIPIAQLDMLQRLAAETKDPEVKAALTARIFAIEDELAINPPPISLNVRNATLPELRAALAKATGSLIPAPQDNLARGDSYARPFTLNVTDAPFWEVMLRLNEQSFLPIQNYEAFTPYAAQSGILRGTRSQGFFIFPMRADHSQEIYYYTQRAPRPPEATLAYQVCADPRVCVIAARPVETLSIIDDAGASLAMGDQGNRTMYQRAGGYVWFAQAPLQKPQRAGAKIALLRGQMEVLSGAGRQRWEVPDVLGSPSPVKAGDPAGTTVTFENLTLKSDPPLLSLRAVLSGKPSPSEKRFPLPMTMELVDADGKRLWQGDLRWQERIDIPDVSIKRPVKAILTAPARVREATIPFELKDLPLPF